MIWDKEEYFIERNKKNIPEEKYISQKKIELNEFLNYYVKRKYRKSLRKNIKDGDIIQLPGESYGLIYFDGYIHIGSGRKNLFLYPSYFNDIAEYENGIAFGETVNSEGFTLDKNIEFESFLKNGITIKTKSDMYTFFGYNTSYENINVMINVIGTTAVRNYTFGDLNNLYVTYQSFNLYDKYYYIGENDKGNYIKDIETKEKQKITKNLIKTHEYFNFEERLDNLKYIHYGDIVKTNDYLYALYKENIYFDEVDKLFYEILDEEYEILKKKQGKQKKRKK